MQPNDPKPSSKTTERDAAVTIARSQLDAVYGSQPQQQHAATPPTAATQQQAPAQQQAAPQQQQHASHQSAGSLQDYHNQWQQYYQNYYERYYVGHLHQALTEQQKAGQTTEEKRDEALVDLRQKIVTKAKTGAKTARRSRHFIPFASALVVVLVVAFLQYNDLLISNVKAYVSPGAIDPQNIVVDPTAPVEVSADPKLIIPKINVDVPVIYGVGYDHDSQMKAMEKGVAHFAIPGANSVPGQVGNTVLSGHSSNDLFDPGDHKFIFAQLDKLQTGDTIFVNYNSVRYTYTITKKEVVKPTEVSKLTYATDKPVLTLITCTPLGTAEKRLLVTAEQVTPDPTKAAAATAATATDTDNAAMTGKAPSALERLFGAR